MSWCPGESAAAAQSFRFSRKESQQQTSSGHSTPMGLGSQKGPTEHSQGPHTRRGESRLRLTKSGIASPRRCVRREQTFADIQKLYGHTNPQTTEIYAPATMTKHRDAIERVRAAEKANRRPAEGSVDYQQERATSRWRAARIKARRDTGRARRRRSGSTLRHRESGRRSNGDPTRPRNS